MLFFYFTKMENENDENINQLKKIEENKYNIEKNPNIKYLEELSDDSIYDSYQFNFNFDVYILYFDIKKIFISYISKKENANIKIIEFSKNNNKKENIILTLKDHKNKILRVKHYFNPINKKDYLLSADLKANVMIYEIISFNEYKLKQKIESRNIRNKRWVCSTVNQTMLFPGMRNKIGMGGMFNKPYHFYDPMCVPGFGNSMDMFGFNKMNMFDEFGFQQNFQEPPFTIDYIDCSLLFFTFTNSYIILFYRESSTLEILDLETLERKGKINDQASIKSLLQWHCSEDNINYLIISKNEKIEILNPLIEKNKSNYVFKDNDNLKGSNYAYYVLYNFRDNNDYLLSYNRNRINIINLNTKNIIISIQIKRNINSILPWNKKYLILSQGEHYLSNIFTYISVIDFDTQKIVSQITENENSVKGLIKKIKTFNNEIYLFTNDSENKIKVWGINESFCNY